MTFVFNWVDYSILIVVLFSVLISFFRGFFREAVSLIVWVIGILVALKFSGDVQGHLEPWISSPTFRYAASFLGLFLGVLLAGALVNAGLHAGIKRMGLSMMDRILGIGFGALRGGMVVSLLLMFLGGSSGKNGAALGQSVLVPYFTPSVQWLRDFLPKQVKTVSEWVGQDEPQSVSLPNISGSDNAVASE